MIMYLKKKSLVVDSPIPYYYQVAVDIMKLIEEDKLVNNEILHSEKILCEKYGVSRVTIRKAIDYLVKKGVLRRIRNRGVIVLKKDKFVFNFFIGLYKDLINRGHQVKNKILSFEKTEPTETIKNLLKLSSDKEIFKIMRLRYVDNEPYSYSEIHLSTEICPNLSPSELINNSFYDIIENKYGVDINYTKRIIESDIASDIDSKLLKVDIGAPIQFVSSITYKFDGSIIEYSTNRFRGDKLKIELIFPFHISRNKQKPE